jgi:hypothetical protein
VRKNTHFKTYKKYPNQIVIAYIKKPLINPAGVSSWFVGEVDAARSTVCPCGVLMYRIQSKYWQSPNDHQLCPNCSALGLHELTGNPTSTCSLWDDVCLSSAMTDVIKLPISSENQRM